MTKSDKSIPAAFVNGVTRRGFVVAGAAGSVAVLAGGVTPAFAAEKPKVGLVQKSLANEFFKQMQAGAEAYAAKNTDKFEFKAVGMKDERDFASQVDAIENFVTQKYNLIVVAPADSRRWSRRSPRRSRPASMSSTSTSSSTRTPRKRPESTSPSSAPTTGPGRSWRATLSPRSSVRAARSSFSRATPRLTMPF